MSCSSSAPRGPRLELPSGEPNEPALWIDGFARPLDLLRVEDARELQAAWSSALRPDAALPERVPPYLRSGETVSAKDRELALSFMLSRLEGALGRERDGAFRSEDAADLRQV